MYANQLLCVNHILNQYGVCVCVYVCVCVRMCVCVSTYLSCPSLPYQISSHLIQRNPI